MFLQLLPLPMGSQRDNWRKRGAPWGYPKVEEQLYRQALLSSCPLLPISYQEQNPHKGDKHRVNDPSTVPDICSGDTQRGTSLVNTGQATWSSDTLCPRTDRAFVGKEGLAYRERDNGRVLLPTWDTQQSVTAPGLSLCGPSDPVSKPSVCSLRQASSQPSRERTAPSDAPAELPPQRRVRPWSGCLL